MGVPKILIWDRVIQRFFAAFMDIICLVKHFTIGKKVKEFDFIDFFILECEFMDFLIALVFADILQNLEGFYL